MFEKSIRSACSVLSGLVAAALPVALGGGCRICRPISGASACAYGHALPLGDLKQLASGQVSARSALSSARRSAEMAPDWNNRTLRSASPQHDLY